MDFRDSQCYFNAVLFTFFMNILITVLVPSSSPLTPNADCHDVNTNCSTRSGCCSNCLSSSLRGGQRKQRQIYSITGHRPARLGRHGSRPPSALTVVPCVSTDPPLSDPAKNKSRPPKRNNNKDSGELNANKHGDLNNRPHVSTNLKVLLINAQSSRNKTELLQDLILDSDADIAFLTESWLRPIGDEVLLDELTPPGFTATSIPRPHGPGGGLCVISKTQLQVVTKEILTFPSFECCESTILCDGKTSTFVAIYRPPPNKKNQQKQSQFIEDLQSLFESYATRKPRPIFLGDFNLHFENSTNPNVKTVKSIISSNSLTQHVDVPTHNKQHTLDWVISDEQTNISNLSVTDISLSDHFLITFNIDIKKTPEKRKITSRKKPTDFSKLENDLEQTIPNIMSSPDLTNAYNTTLRELLDKHAPVVTRTVTDRPSAPWLTEEIKKLKAARRRAERKWRSSRLEIDRQIYRNLHAKVRASIKTAKASYYNQKIQDCPSSRALFEITSKMTGKSKKCDQHKLPTTVPKESLPDAFGQFFQQKITAIRNTLDQSSNSQFPQTSGCSSVFMDFEPVSAEDIKSIIKNSPPKTCNLDPLDSSLVIRFLDQLAPIITAIVNSSLESGNVPKSFKHAIVTPILKKANLSPEELKNFRPVSNLPFVSKILEKVVAVQLNRYLKSEKLLEPNQSAYRPQHNTETALVRIQNDLLCAADEGKVSILALLDLSAAFDTIDHGILIERLSTTFGLKGNVLSWFISYLQNRTQCVSINNKLSSPFPLDYGVPQGSVLGPLLFTLYTQPLGGIIRQHGVEYHMYADDTQLYQSVSPGDSCQLLNTMEECISDVKSWMVANKLQLNGDKTELLFHNPKKLNLPDNFPNTVLIGETQVAFTEKAKNLGVYFDSQLSMSHHVNQLCKSLHFEIRRIGHLANVLSLESLKTLTSAYIFSRIDYCNSLFFALPNVLIKKLQRIQNHAARVILRKKKRDHITPMFVSLHWLPIEKRSLYKIATLCFKCKNGTAPHYLLDLIEDYTPSRQVRSQSKCLFTVPPKKGRTKLSERSFRHAAPHVWNSLPISLRQKHDKSEDAFRSSLKTYLFQCFLNESE